MAREWRTFRLGDVCSKVGEKEIADELMVSTRQVKQWLKRLVEEGVLEKLSAPTRYRATKNSKLF